MFKKLHRPSFKTMLVIGIIVLIIVVGGVVVLYGSGVITTSLSPVSAADAPSEVQPTVVSPTQVVIPTQVVMAQTNVVTVRITADPWLYVRSGAGTHFGSVGTLTMGTTTQVVSPYSGWAQIAPGSQYAGNWISAEWFTPLSNSNPVPYTAPIEAASASLTDISGEDPVFNVNTPRMNVTQVVNGRPVLDIFAIALILFAGGLALYNTGSEAARRGEGGDMWFAILIFVLTFVILKFDAGLPVNLLALIAGSLVVRTKCMSGITDFTPLALYYILLGLAASALGIPNGLTMLVGPNGGVVLLYLAALGVTLYELLSRRPDKSSPGDFFPRDWVGLIIAIVCGVGAYALYRMGYTPWLAVVGQLVLTNIVANIVNQIDPDLLHDNWSCRKVGSTFLCLSNSKDAQNTVLLIILIVSVV